jgi:2-polyprenyl-3-methyl-5-hydroxy-6-metoxy-1,4-benzoquinol methylase
MEDLLRYSAINVHRKVLDCMKVLKRGAVLDVPSGQGALSKDLEKLGFEVFPGDIERKNIQYRNGRCIQLDLNKLLPFKDGSFDYITCVAGIEHLENPHHLIRELSRLIKKEGYLVITTPNVMAIKSRLKFLLYGYFDFFEYFGPPPPEEKQKLKDLGLLDFLPQHINPILYPEMKFILEKNGFRIDRIEANRMVKKWKNIYPFVRWLIKRKTREFQKDPFFISRTILDGEYLVWVTKKEGAVEMS